MFRTAFVGLMAFSTFLTAQEPRPPVGKAAKDAKEALLAYDKAKTALDMVYAGDLTKLRAKLVWSLQEARKVAIVSDDLDEAQRLMAMTRSVEADIAKLNPPEEAPPPPEPEVKPNKAVRFEILYAKYGGQDAWVDATAALRTKVVNGRLFLAKIDDMNALVGDPKVGQWKYLAVTYAVNGNVKMAVFAIGRVALP